MRISKNVRIAFNIAVIALLIFGIGVVCKRFIHLGNVEYTDNAQIKQLVIPVNSRVQGFIKEVCFEEYHHVKKGDTLVIIEDAEYRLGVAQAKADYLNATAGKAVMNKSINTADNNISVTDAGLNEVAVRLSNAEKELERYRTLRANGAATQQQLDNVETEYAATKARYDQLMRQKTTTTLVKQEQTERLGQNDALVMLASARLNLAELNLSHTIITSPCNGFTGRKEITPGQLIQPGQTVVDVVDESEKWVIANYRETQMPHISEGSEAVFKVDAIPGITFHGIVESISSATGAAYSILPQDNATGNFVKVEQRVPVKIKLVPDENAEEIHRRHLLRAGLNVECEIKY